MPDGDRSVAGTLDLSPRIHRNRQDDEEALAEVAILVRYTALSIPNIGQVHMVFRRLVLVSTFGVGTGSVEVDLFKREDIPWEEMAFPVLYSCMRNA